MSEFRLTTVEEFEAATDETVWKQALKVGADSWQARVKNQTPHCKFGEAGYLLPYLYNGSMPYYKEGTKRYLRL